MTGGLDSRIADLGSGGSLTVILAVALLLGLRHASDPDHLTAVSTLIASERERGMRRAARLGLAWGMGHATTLIAFGLPIVLVSAYLPEPVQRVAEAAVGVLIVALAVRLLVRWRAGHFHTHAHRHDGIEHRHLHEHHSGAHDHEHAPGKRLGRTAFGAYGIGLVHGAGGSAGVGVLLIAAVPDRTEAVAALLIFALATALSMTFMSSLAGWALTRGAVVQRMLALAPALGVFSLAFGTWYLLGAAGAVNYPL
jgi:ABC-type nickel/cobalt efflux system permease component RcnA